MQENMDETIDFIVESIKSINKLAFFTYKPIVEEICSGRTVEVKELENVLDGLVSVCLSCLLSTSPSPRDKRHSRMPSSA